MRGRNHVAERVIEEFLTRILTQVLIQLRSDGLTEKGFALANPAAGRIFGLQNVPMKVTR